MKHACMRRRLPHETRETRRTAKNIEEKLKAQETAEKMTRQKVTQWIETRAKRLKL